MKPGGRALRIATDSDRYPGHKVCKHLLLQQALRSALCGAATLFRDREPWRNRSIDSGRLQEHNHLGTVHGRCEPAIRLHVVAGHDLIGFRDEAIELLLVPYKVRALQGAGIAVVLERTGFPSDDIVEV